MNPPDYDGALQYARNRLSRELSPVLRYHNLDHTFGEVLPAAMFLAGQLVVHNDDIQLLRVAAAVHDIGWIIQGKDHEDIGIEICRHILPTFGLIESQIDQIDGMIRATKLPQSPKTLLEEILADADMFTLGSEDFWPRNADLRQEAEALYGPVSDATWYESQLDFLLIHSYHTNAAKMDREQRKQKYIADLLQYLSSDSSERDATFPQSSAPLE